MCGSLNWYLVWGCACMVSLLRATADLPGGRAALCAFADRPTTQRVNIFTSPSEKNPPGVWAKSYTLPLLPNLFTCYWFASGEEEGSACHGLPPCPLPQPSHLFSHLPTACQHVSQKPRTTAGGRVGGGPGAFVSQDTQRESKGLRKLNVKVEHSTSPFEKRLHLRVNEGAILRRERMRRRLQMIFGGAMWVWQLHTASSCFHVPTLPCDVPAAHIVRSFTDGQWEVRQRCAQPQPVKQPFLLCSSPKKCYKTSLGGSDLTIHYCFQQTCHFKLLAFNCLEALNKIGSYIP